LKAAVEDAFAPAAGMNLRLDSNQIGSIGQKSRGKGLGRFGCVAYRPGRCGNPVLLQQLSRLVFVEVYVRSLMGT